jgi:hypothetical protein
VSQVTFQAELARLLIDVDFRTAVRSQGEVVLDTDLTDRERRRLVAVAADPGLDITTTLHQGWRLSKALLMLPFTCALLGNERLACELTDFWRTRPPRSLYFHQEAITFCDWLLERVGVALQVMYLDEITRFERATLQLRTPWAPDPPQPQTVRFDHDPEQLLTDLAAGAEPNGVASRPSLLLGTATEPGKEQWHLIPAD